MRLFLIYAHVFAFFCTIPSSNVVANEPAVLVVSDLDNTTRIQWRKNMNLLEILRQQNIQVYTNVVYLISDNELHPTLISKVWRHHKRLILPDDIIILGRLTEEREKKLRQNPDIDQAFKTLSPRNYRQF